MRKWSNVWFLSVWVILGFLMLLSGVISNRVDNMILSVFVFAVASAYLTSQVKSERRVKKALEVIFMLFSFSVAVYGYILTGSLVLGVITLFIVALIFFAFVASWLLPRIRSRTAYDHLLEKREV